MGVLDQAFVKKRGGAIFRLLLRRNAGVDVRAVAYAFELNALEVLKRTCASVLYCKRTSFVYFCAGTFQLAQARFSCFHKCREFFVLTCRVVCRLIQSR